MGCGPSTKQLKDRINKQNETITKLVQINNDLKAQLTQLQNQEQQLSRYMDAKEKKVIDLTNLATEIDSKFKDLEEILSKIDVMSSKKRDELIKKLEELTEWKQVMKQLDMQLLEQVNEGQVPLETPDIQDASQQPPNKRKKQSRRLTKKQTLVQQQ